jgi:hypothetical protein
VSFFDRFRRRKDEQPRAEASSKTHGELEAFLKSRDGVEAYIEPPTSVYAMTLCLVAADGEYLRRPVKHAKQAHQLCNGHGVPIYDARIVGYPRRMRDYERGLRSNGISVDDLPPLETTDDAERDD